VTRWFARLPIHQKLVLTALAVTTAALAVATVGLVAIDVWRHRQAAFEDTASLAQVIAENTAAAVVFSDEDAASQTLASVRVRPSVRRACLYLPDGTLFAEFSRRPSPPCPSIEPSEAPAGWAVVTAHAPVVSDNRAVGDVYIEQELVGFAERLLMAAAVWSGMLLVAGALAYVLAQRLHRSVSAPIVALAAAARTIGPDGHDQSLARITTSQDEIGELVGAFRGMVGRLLESNEALRREVDERKRIEAEREKLLVREREASRLKDEFLAAVSHELRTPLNAILGWVQILSTTNPSPSTMAKAVASITRNAQAQTRVIEDLVDVSRIVTGKLTLRPERADFASVVESAVDAIRPTADAKPVTLAVQLGARPSLVHGDRDRLQQVVWNLLANAVKFTPAGGAVHVTLSAAAGWLELTVRDTGVGIPRDFLPDVFDRFRQADGSTTREYGGLGLGLSIVKELTELHGGSVAVASEGPGRGATFTLRLPALRDDVVAHPPRVATGSSVSLRGLRVLAVDDNADALEILMLSLTEAGAHVQTARSGAEALEIWSEARADVLVCDLAMPGMDGTAVLNAVRRADAEQKRPPTPAIVITAHVMPDPEAGARAAGFDHYIQKPFETAELLRVVARAAGRA
jgi:signal transduction histidine kinase/CheY-like chemotaxis protein